MQGWIGQGRWAPRGIGCEFFRVSGFQDYMVWGIRVEGIRVGLVLVVESRD